MLVTWRYPQYAFLDSPDKFVHKCSSKKVFLKLLHISQETLLLESLFNQVGGQKVFNFIKKETPTQVFSCEICQLFKNTFLKNICEQLLWLLRILSSFWFLSLNKGYLTKINKLGSIPFIFCYQAKPWRW